MRQVICTQAVVRPSNTAASYGPISTAPSFTSTESNIGQPWAVAGTFSNLVLRHDLAPGAGKSYTFVLRINGVDSALTCQIADTNLTARDITHSVSIAAGDKVVLKCTPVGTPTAPSVTGVWMSLEFTATAAGESGYGHPTTVVISGAGGTRYYPAFAGGGVVATAVAATEILPCAGAITALYLRTTAAVAVAHSFACTFYLNGVKQDGTNGTVNTTRTLVAGEGVVALGTTFVLPVVAGDQVYLEVVKVGTTNEWLGYAVRFTATTDGQSIVSGGDAVGASTSATNYTQAGWSGEAGWNTLETVNPLDGPVMPITLSQLWVLLAGTPGSGKRYTYSVRVNAADPTATLSAAVTDLAVTGSDLVHSVTLLDTQTWNMKSVPTGTPTLRAGRFAMVQGPVAAAGLGAGGGDVNTAWIKKHPPLRTNQRLDLTTAMCQRLATVRASTASSSTDYNTKLRDYYASGGTVY